MIGSLSPRSPRPLDEDPHPSFHVLLCRIAHSAFLSSLVVVLSPVHFALVMFGHTRALHSQSFNDEPAGSSLVSSWEPMVRSRR